jgi:hypothetical protein
MSAQEEAGARIIEQTKAELNSSLERLFGHSDLPSLVEASEALESFAQMEIIDALVDHATPILGLYRGDSFPILVDSRATAYLINACDDASDRSCLHISIRVAERSSPSLAIRKKTFNVASYGQYRKVKLLWARELEPKVELLGALVVMILETCYSWIKDRIDALLGRHANAVSELLYRHVIRLFPKSEMRTNLWLACVTDDKGYRLLDRNVAIDAFDIIAESNKSAFSTNRLVTELLTTWLPRSKLLMQAAVIEKHCINADLGQAQYLKEGSVYAASLQALYGSDSFTVYPISTGGRIAVVALFPTTLRSTIEPVLDLHREAFAVLCDRSLSAITRTYDLIVHGTGRHWDAGMVGELLGGFMKAFTKPE